MATAFGKLIRDHREALNLSLRKVAEDMKISSVYLSEVERGDRPPFKNTRWPSLVCAIPTLSYSELIEKATMSRRIIIDPKRVHPEVMPVLYSLVVAANMEVITVDEIEPLRNVIREAMRKEAEKSNVTK